MGYCTTGDVVVSILILFPDYTTTNPHPFSPSAFFPAEIYRPSVSGPLSAKITSTDRIIRVNYESMRRYL